MKESKKSVKLTAIELSLGFNLHIKIDPETVNVINETIRRYGFPIILAMRWL